MLDHCGRSFGALRGGFLDSTEEKSFREAAGEGHDVLRARGEKGSVFGSDVQNRKIHDSELQEQSDNAGRKRAQYGPEKQLNGFDAKFTGGNALTPVLHGRAQHAAARAKQQDGKFSPLRMNIDL